MSIIDIAKGNRRRGFSRENVGGYQAASTVRNATVQADSDGGTATVLIDGSDEPVTLACEAPVSQGQRCTVAFQSGSYVIVTLGDVPQRAAAAGEAAESAQQAASAAKQAAAAASAAADAAAEQAQAAVDGITDVTATVNGIEQDVTQLTTEVSGAVSAANSAVEAASAAQQDIDGFKQTVSQTYATQGALASTDAKADAASEAAQGAQSAADAAQSDLNAYKGTVSTTYATKTELSQTASSITQSVSESYVTKADAAADYQPKGDYATSGDLDDAIAQEVLNRNSAITQSASEIAQTVSETYQVKGDYATGSELDSAIAQEVLDRNSAIEQSATSITQTVSQTYLSKQDASSTYATKSQLTQTADSINATVSDLSGAVTSVTQTADSLTIQLGEAEEDIAAAKSTATQAKNDAASAQSTATQAKTAADEAKTEAEGASSAASSAQSAAEDAADDAASALNRATYQFGTCSTAAGTAAKVVALSGFARFTGATVQVKFTYANTASSPTLNVNSTGAAQIRAYGAALTSSSAYNWVANAVVAFVFDGTYWNLSDGASLSKANSAQSTANSAQSAAGSAQSTANSAKSAATAAQTAANNAAKTATNFIQASSAGVMVGDMQKSGIGGNTLITPDGVQVRDGTSVLADFGADSMTLFGGEAGIVTKEGFGIGDVPPIASFICGDAYFGFMSGANPFDTSNRYPTLRTSLGRWATWGDNELSFNRSQERLLSVSLLFESSGGTSSTITLQDNLALFEAVDIVYGDGSGRKWTQRVYNRGSSSATTSLFRVVGNSSQQSLYISSLTVSISGTRATLSNSLQWTTGGAGTGFQGGNIVIYAVYGWR